MRGERETWGKRNSTGVVIASSLSLNNISFSDGETRILDDVSLKVSPGKILCLLGPSGSGKTSLLRIAAGLVRQTSGNVDINDRTVADQNTFVPPEERGIGLVFQDYALFPHLTILENVEFGLTALNRKEKRNQAMQMLSRVGMSDRAEHYPHLLSGGEQQRVALARALAPRPGILLMDEPFSGLDARMRDTVREQSIELLRETRSTVVIVTHDPEEALRLADHIAIIRDGKLVQEGTGHDLYHHPNSLFVAGFFAEVNVISAQVEAGIVKTPFGDFEVADHANIRNGQTNVAIRHCDLVVTPQNGGNTGLDGRILVRKFVGNAELLEIRVTGLEWPISARIEGGVLDPGIDLANVSIKPGSIMVFTDG